MYHLVRGFHEYLTRKDEFSIVIIGLDNVSLFRSLTSPRPASLLTNARPTQAGKTVRRERWSERERGRTR